MNAHDLAAQVGVYTLVFMAYGLFALSRRLRGYYNSPQRILPHLAIVLGPMLFLLVAQEETRLQLTLAITLIVWASCVCIFSYLDKRFMKRRGLEIEAEVKAFWDNAYKAGQRDARAKAPRSKRQSKRPNRPQPVVATAYEVIEAELLPPEPEPLVIAHRRSLAPRGHALVTTRNRMPRES
jgi:hypothetical protein